MATEEDVCWFIDEIKRYNRRPPWFNEADSFGPIDPIFQRDAVVCLAYRCAKRRAYGTTRFDGQAKLRRQVKQLDDAASSHKEALIMKLSEIISPKLRQEVASWADKPSRKKRPRNKSVSPPATGVAAVPAQSTTNESSGTLDTPEPPQNLFSATENSLVVMSPVPVDRHPPISLLAGDEAQQDAPRHSFSTTSITQAQNLLPDPLYRALHKSSSAERQTFVAHIGMSYGNTDKCVLTLTVSTGQVERIAEALFDLHLQTINGSRDMFLGRRQILTSAPITVKGCQISAIEKLFGQQIYEAVCASPTLWQDSLEKSDITRAVSIQVSRDISEVGVLILHIGLCPCVNIWKTLGPSKLTPSFEIPRCRDTPRWESVMPFTIHELDSTITFDDAQSTPCWVVGDNQQIFWRSCFMRVYTDMNKQLAQASCETCDGQCIVPKGKELFLGGDGGYVKLQE
ncbi:hypothetical protein F5Y09DRAFT_300532 [Xylaria sp. FL1042]|nr:hypothetical protein F5Y09DRAFT_300532 [Xylaria sp. FL1042]